MQFRNNAESSGVDYQVCVNRAIDYILTHLDQPLRLDSIAKVAGFSPFHFHRIFRSLVGETLQQFVNRLRLERALKMLAHDGRVSLTDVAFACGFASSSDFSRSFKLRYGVPPSAFDLDTFRARRREDWQAAIMAPHQRHLLRGLPAGENPDGFEVQFKSLPKRYVAYLRVVNSYRPHVVEEAAAKLVAWARERGLEGGQWLGYMWDDPEIVAHEKCRYDVGVEVPDSFTDAEVGCFEFPAMRVATLELRGGIDLEMRALDWIYRTWLPRSGYVPNDRPCFEAWRGIPFEHGTEHFELDLQLPVIHA